MCGRYLIDDEMSGLMWDIFREIDRKLGKGLVTPGVITPGRVAPILVAEHQEISASLSLWGIPGYQNKLVINARAETCFEKPMFRERMRAGRCIVPANGFYEWDANRCKFYFEPEGEELLYMAGLYCRDVDQTRYVVMTTQANASVQSVHHRMPVCFRGSEVEEWLFEDAKVSGLLTKTPPGLVRQGDYEQLKLPFLFGEDGD